MTCADFQRKLSAYTDGELSRWTRWKVQQHLGHCADCSGLLREFEEIDGALLGAFAAEPAPHYLTDAVMRRLPAMPPAWRRPAIVVRWATAGALAGAQLLAVYGAYWWGFSRANTLPGPGARGGMTTPAGAVGARLPNSPTRTPSAVAGSDRSAPPSVWGRRDLTFPMALPESVVQPETRRRGFPMPEFRSKLQPSGAH